MYENLKFDDLILQGINLGEGLSYTGSKEKYLAALQRFFRRSQSNRSAIREAAKDTNPEDLTLLVHALKSNAKTIGADKLSKIAEEMEEMGKSGDREGMLSRLEDLMIEYGEVIEIIRPYGEMEEVHPASEISAQEAAKAGKELVAALEDYDDDKAIESIELLMHYPFRFTLINVLKSAEQDIKDFEYTEALIKVRRVISQIED